MKQNRLLREEIEHKSKGDRKGEGSGDENSKGRREGDGGGAAVPKRTTILPAMGPVARQ